MVSSIYCNNILKTVKKVRIKACALYHGETKTVHSSGPKRKDRLMVDIFAKMTGLPLLFYFSQEDKIYSCGLSSRYGETEN